MDVLIDSITKCRPAQIQCQGSTRTQQTKHVEQIHSSDANPFALIFDHPILFIVALHGKGRF